MNAISNLPTSKVISVNGHSIYCFDDLGDNIDSNTVNSFGEEWKAFHGFSNEEIKKGGDLYFDIVTPGMLGQDKVAIDFGCGSGRWTKYIQSSVGKIVAVDPSDAIISASSLLRGVSNVELYKASISNLPFHDNAFDFGFSLGVLHHIPDTQKAMIDCVKKIKPRGHFLVYLYYNLDNRGYFFKVLFNLSNLIRKIICRLPGRIKRIVCDVLAVLFYMPLVLLCRLLRIIGVPESTRRKIPLQIYEKTSFYNIRTDSLDRFGTPLEQRFSKEQIQLMMENAGLGEIMFSDNAPYWHAVGKKIS
jgi:SAM-dependent methyltransferase